MILAVGWIVLFLLNFGDPAGSGEPWPHPVVAGARIDDGRLSIALGCEPPVEASVFVRFNPTQQRLGVASPQLEFRASSPLAMFNPLALPPDVEVDTALPADFELGDQESLSVALIIPGVRSSYPPDVSLGDLAADSVGRPPGVYWFGVAGWLTPQEVAARDGVDLLTVCSTLPK